MIFVGVDIVEVKRISSAIARWEKRFLNRVYTETELKTCKGNHSSLATRFAAKEAVMKALGTGTAGISWKEIEVLVDGSGKPLIKLRGKAQIKAEELHISEFAISVSDTRQYAIATVIGERHSS